MMSRRLDGLAEAEIEDRLVDFLEATGAFRVLRQVVGRALWAPCPSAGRVRCDVLVLASRRGLTAGWRAGPILFEVKRPDRAIGPGLCQVMDYLECVFRLPPNGVEVLPAFGFLFPFPKVHGPLASVLAQNRAGTCRIERGRLSCWCGEQRVVTVCEDGTLDVGVTSVGKKFGSRRI